MSSSSSSSPSASSSSSSKSLLSARGRQGACRMTPVSSTHRSLPPPASSDSRKRRSLHRLPSRPLRHRAMRRLPDLARLPSLRNVRRDHDFFLRAWRSTGRRGRDRCCWRQDFVAVVSLSLRSDRTSRYGGESRLCLLLFLTLFLFFVVLTLPLLSDVFSTLALMIRARRWG